MKLITKHFGEIDINERKVIQFSSGLPGFPEDKEFIILSDPENESGMQHWMQSIHRGDIAFVILDTFKMLPDYNPLVNMEELEELAPFKEDELLVYNIAVIPDDINKATVNLKAPVIINPKNNKGKQVITNNDEYHIKHLILEEINKNGK